MFQQKTYVEIDRVAFGTLAMQTAATVMFICETRSPDLPRPGKRQCDEVFDPIDEHLSNYVSFSPTNAFQSMVELLYDYVKLELNNPSFNFILRDGGRRLITDALAAYQNWKTAYITAQNAKYGSSKVKDASEFNKKDWTDLNEEFLSPVTN